MPKPRRSMMKIMPSESRMRQFKFRPARSESTKPIGAAKGKIAPKRTFSTPIADELRPQKLRNIKRWGGTRKA